MICISEILLFLPLIGALLAYLSYQDKLSMFISCCCVGIATILGGFLFYEFSILRHTPLMIKLCNWISVTNLNSNWSIYIDSLSATMIMVVTSVSFLVHLYSIGYMSEDKSKRRFFSYLSLFTFFMLVLVVADNFAQLFVGWEGVGLSSYLLIGFWYQKQPASNAAMKAFLVNRVGDIGLALGIFAIAAVFGSIEYSSVLGFAKFYSLETLYICGIEFPAIPLICLLLFIGCMGKSAQLGLHVWLPDAMEGPTPVSALIHAATMVTAGVFLVARCFDLFAQSPQILDFILILGTATSLFAALVALGQNDIKKIVAYSTCSQLGYMFIAAGSAAWGASVFHLFTHAFFKALLFLGCGSVIHALSGEQDIRKMGALYKKLPYTHAMMLIGSAALAGIPLFAGFFSKDAILEAAYARGDGLGLMSYCVGVSVAFLTAFYSWRLLIHVFYGAARSNNKPHESGPIMLIPLFALCLGAVFAGAFGKYITHMDSPVPFWSYLIKEELEGVHHELLISIMPSIAAILGVICSYILYYNKAVDKPATGFIVNLLQNKFYIDELYECILIKPYMKISRSVFFYIELSIIDRISNVAYYFCKKLSRIFASIQSGKTHRYIYSILVGLIALGYLYFRKVI